jgi:hypothetical protein
MLRIHKRFTHVGRVRTVAVGTLLALAVATSFGGILPGKARLGGRTLDEWQDIYGRTWLENNLRTNDEKVGKVVLLDAPEARGLGLPASRNVMLSTGDSLFLQLWALYGFDYGDGTSDPKQALEVFETLDIVVTVDGKTVIDSSNVLDYYSAFDFDPAIPFIGSISIAWFQGIGMALTPLSPGTHTITLDVVNTEPLPPEAFPPYLQYHNTWNITVKPGR